MAYVAGLGVVLLFIALLGQSFVEKMIPAASETGRVKKIIGVVLIIIAFIIFAGFDKTLGAFLLDVGFIDVAQFELDI